MIRPSSSDHYNERIRHTLEHVPFTSNENTDYYFDPADWMEILGEANMIDESGDEGDEEEDPPAADASMGAPAPRWWMLI